MADEPLPTVEPARVRRWLAGYLRPHASKMGLGLLCAAVAGTLPGGVAAMIRQFADRSASGDASGVLWVSLAVVGLYTLLVALRYGQATLLTEVTQRAGLALRRDVYAHLQRMPLAFFHSQRTGALMAALTNDVGRLQNAAMLVKDGIALPITAVTMGVILVRTSPRLVLFTVAVVPVMALVIQRITRRLRALSQQTQALQAEVNAVMDETLSAPRIVKAFVAEEREVRRFEAASDAAFHAQMRGVRRLAWLGPTVDWVGAVAIGLVLYFGAHEIAQRTMTLGAFLQFVFAANELARSVGGMGGLRGAWQEMLGAADRIFGQILGIEPEVADAPDAVALPPVKGRIVFERVSFAYEPGHPVLQEIDLTIEPGEVVAFVGPTGAGKSTLADLVPRFYDPVCGRVCIDGYDVKRVTLESLRRQIGIVPQRTLLFSGTIRDNIAYGRPGATDDEVIAAACAAGAHEFIVARPEGYGTLVGERGATLSGGQGQRIAIARALLADPRILILDEATSALDTGTEALVQEALETLMRGRTTLVIAHRLSTVVGAHRIVVLQHGRVAESGTHAQLLAARGLYASLYEAQQRGIDP